MSTVQSFRKVPLKFVVLAMLSLASQQGQTKTPVIKLYKAIANLTEEFSGVFPPMVFTRTEYSAYSKRLDDALQELVGSSVDLPNPRLRELVLPPEIAEGHLTFLREKYGTSMIDNLQPIVERLVDEINRQPDP